MSDKFKAALTHLRTHNRTIAHKRTKVGREAVQYEWSGERRTAEQWAAWCGLTTASWRRRLKQHLNNPLHYPLGQVFQRKQTYSSQYLALSGDALDRQLQETMKETNE